MLSQPELRKLMPSGRFGLVVFRKRTDGAIRRMICRFDVSSELGGAGRPYDPEHYNLAFVYDVQKRAFRSIPLDAVLEVRSGPRKWENPNNV